MVGATESMELELDMKIVPSRTQEILASCHALVFVENKLVRWFQNLTNATRHFIFEHCHVRIMVIDNMANML